MAQPAYVSVESNAAGDESFGEKARAYLVIQYDNKAARLEIGIRGIPIDPYDYAEQRRALLELVDALEAWREEGGNMYTSPRA